MLTIEVSRFIVIGVLLFPLKALAQEIDGKSLYRFHCASCHDEKVEMVGPSINQIIKDRSAEWCNAFISSSDSLAMSGDSIAFTIASTTGLAHMYRDVLSEAERRRLVEYLYSLKD